jgi:hypothetical protein
MEMMMNRMTNLTLAVATTVALGAEATSSAYAGSEMQGPLRSGIALQSFESKQPLITAVALPCGETVDLRRQATDSIGPDMTINSWVEDHEGWMNGGLKKTPTE